MENVLENKNIKRNKNKVLQFLNELQHFFIRQFENYLNAQYDGGYDIIDFDGKKKVLSKKCSSVKKVTVK